MYRKNGGSIMTVFEKMRRKQIPEYYDGMYLDGFTP